MKKSYTVIIASVCAICAVTGAAATYFLISKRNRCREKSKNEEIKETLRSFFEKNFSGKKHRPEQEKSKNEDDAEIENNERAIVKDNSNECKSDECKSDTCENTVTESILPESDSKTEILEIGKENSEENSSLQTELADDKNETTVLKKKKSGGRGRKKGRGARTSDPEETKENDITQIIAD